MCVIYGLAVFCKGSGSNPLPVRVEISSAGRAGQGVTTRKCTQSGGQIYRRKTWTEHRPPPSLFQFALSPEQYSKYKLFVLSPTLLRGLFSLCVCSFQRPTTVLLIKAVFIPRYQLKGLEMQKCTQSDRVNEIKEKMTKEVQNDPKERIKKKHLLINRNTRAEEHKSTQHRMQTRSL